MVLILCTAGIISTSLATDKQEEAENPPEILKKGFEKNIEGWNLEDIDMVMSTVHPESPNYTSSKRFAEKMFDLYDLHSKMLSKKYIGTDGEYSVLRVKLKTTKINGPEFKESVIDTLHVFRKEDYLWKFWAGTTLEVKYIEPEKGVDSKEEADEF